MIFIRGIGVILTVAGVIMMAVPNLVGSIVISVLAFFLGLSALGIIITSLAMRRFTVLPIGFILLGISGAVFVRPTMVLTILGIGMIASAIWGVLFSPDRRSLLSSILLVLIGIFAIVNSNATMNTIVMIIGVMTFFVGLVLMLMSTGVRYAKMTFSPDRFFYRNREHNPTIDIRQEDSNGAEEVDFKEIK